MAWETEKAAYMRGLRIQGWSEMGLWTLCCSPSWSEAPGVKYRIHPDDAECRSPYCECTQDKCNEGMKDMRGVPLPGQDGWIEWNGGECPVSGGVRVETCFRGELAGCIKETGWADNWAWDHTGGGSDIVAYRIVKSESESAPALQPEPIPHADIIRAILDGKVVQQKDTAGEWVDLISTGKAAIHYTLTAQCEFRIKPEPEVRWYPMFAATAWDARPLRTDLTPDCTQLVRAEFIDGKCVSVTLEDA